MMGRKGQITAFVIIGILVISAALFLMNLSKNSTPSLSNDAMFSVKNSNFREYVKQCMDLAVTKANFEYGLNEKNKYLYAAFVKRRVQSCVGDLFDNYKKEGYNVEEGELTVTILFEEEVVLVKLNYPITLKIDENKYSFDSLEFTFRRTNMEKIDDKEAIVLSSDGKARITIDADTIAENVGNRVTSLGIKIIDKNFDGLENNIVVGNLVYEGLPDKTTFSKPVKISIDFRAKDYPEYVNEQSLTIAWWDENLKIWRGLETEVKDGVATAEANHFTKFAVVIGCGSDDNKIIETPYLFQQKYSLMHPPIDKTQEVTAQLNDYTEQDNNFCKNPGDYWYKDEPTYIPSYVEYIKILEQGSNRISESVQEAEGEITYDGCTSLGEMMMADDVPAYHCYNKKDLCKAADKNGLQECMAKEEFTLDDFDKTITDSECKLSETLANKNIIGYPKGTCIGGEKKKADGILIIDFKGNGDSCINERDGKVDSIVVTPIIKTGGKCEITINGETFSSDKGYKTADKIDSTNKDGFQIVIQSAKVTADLDNGDSFCQNCLAEIKLTGTGFDAKGFTLCDGKDAGMPKMVNGICNTCIKNDVLSTPGNDERGTPGNDVYTANEVGGDCRCTADIAYCKGPSVSAVCYGGVYYENWKNNPNIKEPVDESICSDCLKVDGTINLDEPKCDQAVLSG
ncbi:MAG: hypothetical protein ABIJ34_05995 [archaeon]